MKKEETMISSTRRTSCGVKGNRDSPGDSIKGASFSHMNNVCYICGCALTKENKTRDHVIPRSIMKRLGEPSGREWNLRPCCNVCNVKKGHSLTEESLRLAAEHG